MEQIFNLEDLTGKVIKDIIEEDRLIITFKDSSFAVFHTYESSESVYISDDKLSLTPDRWNYNRLFYMGLLTEAQRDYIYNQIQVESNNSTKEYELKQLDALKAKYPNA